MLIKMQGEIYIQTVLHLSLSSLFCLLILLLIPTIFPVFLWAPPLTFFISDQYNSLFVIKFYPLQM